MLHSVHRRVVKFRDKMAVRQSFFHVSGPRRFDVGDDEAVLICVGRNTAFYLPTLFDWHRKLGIKKFVYVDNGSDDESVSIASNQPDTIVARCGSSFKDFEGLIRFYATDMFARGGWRLVVDADELFDFPGSRNTGMQQLLRMLNASGKTAVVSQMLDMFPDGGLSDVQNDTYETAIASSSFYDIASIEKRDYFAKETNLKWFLDQNVLYNADVKFHYKGIRSVLFGEDCCLSKHPLFKPEPSVGVLPNPHVSTGLCCADFTALLRHYKFTGDFVAREKSLLKLGRVAHSETALRVSTFARKPDLRFIQPTSRRYSTPEALLDEGFLVMPQTMRKFFEID